MSVLHEHRCRRDTLRVQLADIEARVHALVPRNPPPDWHRGTCAERIELFLRRHALMGWSPAELIEATLCSVAAVRRALTRLMRERRIERDWHAHYRARRR